MKLEFNARAKAIYSSCLRGREALYKKSYIDIYNKSDIYKYLDYLSSSEINIESDIEIELDRNISISFYDSRLEYIIIIASNSTKLILKDRINKYNYELIKLNIKINSYKSLDSFLKDLYIEANMKANSFISRTNEGAINKFKSSRLGLHNRLNRIGIKYAIGLILCIVLLLALGPIGTIGDNVLFSLIPLIIIITATIFILSYKFIRLGKHDTKMALDSDIFEINGKVKSIRPILVLKRDKHLKGRLMLDSLYLNIAGRRLIAILEDPFKINYLEALKIKRGLRGRNLNISYYDKSLIVVNNSSYLELIELIEKAKED